MTSLFTAGLYPLHSNSEDTMKVGPACPVFRNPALCCPKQALNQFLLSKQTSNKVILGSCDEIFF